MAAPGDCSPCTALSLLRPAALDVVRYYPPWCGALAPRHHAVAPGQSDLEPGELELEERPQPAHLLYPALCGIGSLSGLEDHFTPLSLAPQRRPRSEKKPTPEEQKDQRYLERRRRNNRAAKKSRDARRAREDQVALRAALLEHENAVLRAQVMTLREETHSLRQLLIHGKSLPHLQHLQQQLQQLQQQPGGVQDRSPRYTASP